MTQQAILHKGEEYGQSRELKASEVKAHTLMAGIESIALSAAGGLAVVVFQGVQGDVSWGTIGTAAATGVVVGGFSFAFHVSQNFGELRDGLRSWRTVETFAPPQPEAQAEPPHPPIVVKPYKGAPYTLVQPERLALPGRDEALQLSPPVVAEILKASLEEYGGRWSRRKLMSLKVYGQRVSRGMYEELTSWLSKAGFLQQTRRGGFMLPPDVSEFEDLRRYFPSLPELGGMGGSREGWERGGPRAPSPMGEVGTLAERRKQRWLECGCDVKLYKEGDNGY